MFKFRIVVDVMEDVVAGSPASCMVWHIVKSGAASRQGIEL